MTYDREVLVSTLVRHWPTKTSGCGCGWAELGRSHPEHVADMYEAAMDFLTHLPTTEPR
jgi:hypothetical protein